MSPISYIIKYNDIIINNIQIYMRKNRYIYNINKQ